MMSKQYHHRKSREWAIAHPERIREIQLKSYQKHRTRRREEAKQLRIAERKKVLDFYGNRCACCGETTYEFLTLDHVNGNGRKHLREIRCKNIYTWLCKTFPNGDFPREMFQTLCYNCNCAKGHYGYCPHSKESK